MADKQSSKTTRDEKVAEYLKGLTENPAQLNKFVEWCVDKEIELEFCKERLKEVKEKGMNEILDY